MKKIIFIFLFVLGSNNIISQSVLSPNEYKDYRDKIIKEHLVDNIGEIIIVDVKNKKKKRKIFVQYLIISIDTDKFITNEFGKKEKLNIYKKIYSKKELEEYDNYKFINAHFLDLKTNKSYQTTYSIYNKNTKYLKFQICYKIKNKTGKKRKLNYLHIKVY